MSFQHLFKLSFVQTFSNLGRCVTMYLQQLCSIKSIQITVCSRFPRQSEIWFLKRSLVFAAQRSRRGSRERSLEREVGWKANLGDVYVLRVPLGLSRVGRIWQKDLYGGKKSSTLLKHGKLSPDKDSYLKHTLNSFSALFFYIFFPNSRKRNYQLFHYINSQKHLPLRPVGSGAVPGWPPSGICSKGNSVEPPGDV